MNGGAPLGAQMIECVCLGIWAFFSCFMVILIEGLPSANYCGAVLFSGVIALIFYLPVKLLLFIVEQQ